MNLEAQIEGVLFYKTEPMKKEALASLFKVTPQVLEDALTQLENTLATRGVRLVSTDTVVQLTVTPELAPLIEEMKKEELSSDIGKAGAETLAIIMYRGPLSRIEIDRIRGVNSTFIIRNLLVRGLIERRDHPTDTRSYTYAVTPTLLNHLGISRREELPEFESIMNALDTFEKQDAEERTNTPSLV